MTTTTSLGTSSVLAAARRARITADQAEAEQMAAAVEWAGLHEVTNENLAATFGDTPVLIAGEGAPMIAAEAIAEFAAVVGMSTNAGRYYIGQAIELAHRLPRVYARIQAGTLPAWRGRRIAEVTLALSPQAAEFVDVRIAPFAHKTNPAETQRLVDTAIATLMPEYAAERREQAAEGRHFTFNHNQVSFAGTTVVWGELDMADALDLDAVIATEAAALKDLGNEDSLDVRRAVAVGNLARGQLSLKLADGTRVVEEGRQGLSRNHHIPRRDVTLYVHLTPDSEIASVENAGTHLVTKDQVTEWCGIEGTRVFIRRSSTSTQSSPPAPTWSPTGSASTSSCATGPASSRTARRTPAPAMPTTTTPTTVRTPAPATSGRCAATTTGSRPTPGGPTRSSNPGPTSGPHPTATNSSATATAPRSSPQTHQTHQNHPASNPRTSVGSSWRPPGSARRTSRAPRCTDRRTRCA